VFGHGDGFPDYVAAWVVATLRRNDGMQKRLSTYVLSEASSTDKNQSIYRNEQNNYSWKGCHFFRPAEEYGDGPGVTARQWEMARR